MEKNPCKYEGGWGMNNKPIDQELLVVAKYHPATESKGSRVSYRTTIPNSKRIFKGFDYRFDSIEEQVKHHLSNLGAVLICKVQMANNSEVGLVYKWNPAIINTIGIS